MELLKEISNEPASPNLADYLNVIGELRKKGRAWRHIALFLSGKGIPCTHNEVYYLARTQAKLKLERECLGEPLDIHREDHYIESRLESMDIEKEAEERATNADERERYLEDGP